MRRSIWAAIIVLLTLATFTTQAHATTEEPAEGEPPVETIEGEEIVDDGGCAATGASLGESDFCAGTIYTITKSKVNRHTADFGYVSVGMQVRYRADPYDSYNYVTVEWQKAYISSYEHTAQFNTPRLYDVDFRVMNNICTATHVGSYDHTSGSSGWSVTKWWNYGRAADLCSSIHYKLNLRNYSDPGYTWKTLLNG